MHKIDVLWKAMSLKKVADLQARVKKLKENDDHEEAEKLASEALLLKELCYGPDHLELADDLYHLGVLNLSLSKLEKAREYLSKALSIQERELGHSDNDVIETRLALARLEDTARESAAIRQIPEAIEIESFTEFMAVRAPSIKCLVGSR